MNVVVVIVSVILVVVVAAAVVTAVHDKDCNTETPLLLNAGYSITQVTHRGNAFLAASPNLQSHTPN